MFGEPTFYLGQPIYCRLCSCHIAFVLFNKTCQTETLQYLDVCIFILRMESPGEYFSIIKKVISFYQDKLEYGQNSIFFRNFS